MADASIFDEIIGVDFSGAKLAGLNIWVARLDRVSMTITALDRLGDLAKTDDREPALAYFVNAIAKSHRTLWGIDFPFALPIEIAAGGLPAQLDWVGGYGGDAYAFGRACVERAQQVGTKMHIRRDTDRETKTPFDCYHYRIICQTFHGMRQVIRPLRDVPGTIIPPFDDMTPCERAVVESCPGSTLKRWGAPHNNYKQPAGGPLEAKRVKNRKIILDHLRQYVQLPPAIVRKMQRNPGGDAIDAVLAAVGTLQSWEATDAAAVATHPRYRLEGRIFA